MNSKHTQRVVNGARVRDRGFVSSDRITEIAHLIRVAQAKARAAQQVRYGQPT